jgi:hypothetical protein
VTLPTIARPRKPGISKLSEEYLRTRTEHQHVKLLAAQMELAARRGELLSRKLAETQLAYLLVCMRRQLLSFRGGARRATSRPERRPQNQDGARRRLLEVFQSYCARRKGGFVIESDSPPPPFDAPYGVYRCQTHMPLQSRQSVSRYARHNRGVQARGYTIPSVSEGLA